MDWVDAQFIGATKVVYPRPSNLYSKRAIERWKEYSNFVTDFSGIIRSQQQVLAKYCAMWTLEPRLVVLFYCILPFKSWFIAAHADTEDIPLKVAEEAKAVIGGTKIREALVEAGYDPEDIEAKIDERLEKA
jgi:hypothetical protein